MTATAFIDEIAVERAMLGDPVRLTRLERREVVRVLTARGVSAAEVARRLHMTARSVHRLRSAERADVCFAVSRRASASSGTETHNQARRNWT